MGMFDYIVCDQPLPDGFELTKGDAFQSKDFCCLMETYTITETGKLARRYVSGHEPVPESEWQYNEAEGALEKIWHEQSKQKPIYSTCDMNFHGWLNFYASEGSRRDGTWEWHEYRAKFTDGTLVEIVSVPETKDC